MQGSVPGGHEPLCDDGWALAIESGRAAGETRSSVGTPAMQSRRAR